MAPILTPIIHVSMVARRRYTQIFTGFVDIWNISTAINDKSCAQNCVIVFSNIFNMKIISEIKG